jgi:site-specific DNA-cytosine methylase
MLSDLASPQWLPGVLKRCVGTTRGTTSAGSDHETGPATNPLHTVLHNMVTNMRGAARVDLHDKLVASAPASGKRPALTISTACSGTDVCMASASALSATLELVLGLDASSTVTFQQGFACEIDSTKRCFLERVQGVNTIYKDICHLGNTLCQNEVTDTVAAVQPMDILVVGFSCKDLSSLNSKMAKSSGARSVCLSTGSGTSSATFRGTLAACAAHRPKLVIMENVPAVLREGAKQEEEADTADVKNWDFIASNFADLGYVVHRRFLDAASCGFPQSRGRIYMCACRLLPPHTREYLLGAFDNAYDAIGVVQPLPLPSFLLTEAEVQQWDAKCPKRCKQEVEGAHWVSNHAAAFREHSVPWPPPAEETATKRFSDAGQPLTTREAELLLFFDQTKPLDPTQDAEQVLDLSQDIRRVKVVVGKSPCLTPNGVHWLRRAGRRMRGEEMLRLQGLCPADRKLLFEFSDGQLRDLAGNAFNAGSFAVALLAALQVVDFS